MFDGIFEAIENWMRDLLTGMVTSNLTTMFTDVNDKTGQIASQVGQTPQGWNGSIFSLIQNLPIMSSLKTLIFQAFSNLLPHINRAKSDEQS